MKIKAFVCAAALAVSWGSASSAQDSEDALAREMLSISGEADVAVDAMLDMIPMIEATIRNTYPDLSSRQYVQIMDVYSAEFEAARAEFEDAIAAVYVEEFTEAELRALLDFYHSDIGQRYAQAMPAIQERAGRAGEQIGLDIDRRATPRIRAIILGND